MTSREILDTLEILTANLSPAAEEVIFSLTNTHEKNGALDFYFPGAPSWMTEAETPHALLESLKDALCDGSLLVGMEQEDVEEVFVAVMAALKC